MADLVTRDLNTLIATEVRANTGDLIDGVHAAALREMLVDRGVLVFRDLEITTDQQRDITATLGPIQSDNDGTELQNVTIDARISPEYAAYFASTLFWHLDGHHNQTVPCFGGSFRPIHLAGDGGETEFLNAYAAYEALDERDRSLIDGLHVFHSATTSGLSANPDATDAQIAAWRRRPPARQPLVWQHASGRKSLMLGVAVSHVEGMHPADSYDLLCRLRSHMNDPAFIYRHSWRANDLVIWNNTGTLHRARPFDPTSGRLLHRFTLVGDEAIQAPM
ncbi:TauD/TfdA dioxygenase family protein [Novosphingobium sp. JCM 18896]|uniref:TauD/TfdA dioxygenase family protein n=1 Tax=Novosphingobium sp. JCM 18896 TaxID=2989731 RepID=UPI0022220CDE|nr:TauD/TfdA family dioxygenase [Novosphingobium sp. JCM 18896]MCW1431224.1 TauD/TfdA family dioxygenase [Novosphingobium sp. JCM 18896]